MQSKKYTSEKLSSGFCGSCHKNVPHRRWIGNPVAVVFDLITFRATRWLRIGPWYCVHCDDKSTLLPFRRPDAIDYRSAALGNEEEPAKCRRPNSEKGINRAAAPLSVQQATTLNAELEPAESVGNFIKTDSSLLIRSNRLQRYSEKYRDAVVRRILTAASSIKQIREEKQLSESEVTDWIADLFERQQQKIDTLELFKKSITEAELPSKNSLRDIAVGSQSIPGRVGPY